MITKNQIKYIQSLGQKKSRDADNVFVAEGPKLIDELLEAGNCNITALYAVEEWINSTKLSSVTPVEISPGELEKISQLKTPNQVLAVVEKIKWEKDMSLKGYVSLLLDDIQDPGNLGTIIRLADWFGVRNIFCSKETADVYNPKVIQATMGSITRVRVEYIDLLKFLTEQKDIRSYAAVLDGREISKMEKLNEGFIIVGNESKGINKELLGMTNVKITIPKKGNAESLNAAVATGIILSHLV